MILETIHLTDWDVNCYLVGDEGTGEAIVIDPGAEPERILHAAKNEGLTITLIVNTHGHADHIAANREIVEATGAPIAIGSPDAAFLTDPVLNLSTLLAEEPLNSPEASRLLNDGDAIQLGDLVLKVLSTPGHTPGGICLLGDECIFTGDTLFAGAVGRWDFPYSDHDALFKGIHEKLMTLPDPMAVYPGHGPKSTIGEERRMNPYVKGDEWL